MTQVNDRISVAVGRSAQRDTRRAVEEALEPVLRLGGPFALALAYAGIDHDHRLIADTLTRRLGDAPLLGCTTTGEITPAGILSGGLVVVGVRSGLLDAAVGLGRDVFADPARAARAAVEAARARLDARGGPARRHRLCLLHASGFTLDHPGVEEDVLAAVRDALGDEWQVVGGSSSDGARFLGSREWAGRDVVEGGVAVALLATDLDVHHAMAHGFVPTDRSYAVTEVAGRFVKRLEGRLAADFYADLLGVRPKDLTKGLGVIRLTDKVPKFLTGLSQKAGLTPQMITERIPFFGYALANPFGVKTGDSYVVKVPKVVTPEGWLEFQTRLDGVDRLHRMRLDQGATLTASARAAAEVRAAAGDRPPALTLVFECLGRFMHLHKEIDELFRAIRASTDAPIAGFFCAAEQGTMAGVGCRTHNYTTSVVGLG